VANRLATLPLGDHTDPATEGLQLRVREKRVGKSRTWLFRFTWRGEWVRQTIGHSPGTSLVEAREIAQGLQKKLGQGIDPRRALPRRSAVSAAPSLSAAAVRNEHTIESVVQEFTLHFPGAGAWILQKDTQLIVRQGALSRALLPARSVQQLHR
jgi:hypothetical protein